MIRPVFFGSRCRWSRAHSQAFSFRTCIICNRYYHCINSHLPGSTISYHPKVIFLRHGKSMSFELELRTLSLPINDIAAITAAPCAEVAGCTRSGFYWCFRRACHARVTRVNVQGDCLTQLARFFPTFINDASTFSLVFTIWPDANVTLFGFILREFKRRARSQVFREMDSPVKWRFN